MAQYIDKDDLENILRRLWKEDDGKISEHRICYNKALQDVQCSLDTLEMKEVGLTDKKTDWYPSNKQIESLRDLLKYNIGVFDYQKFMEVKSLYDSLTKICDYETVH